MPVSDAHYCQPTVRHAHPLARFWLGLASAMLDFMTLGYPRALAVSILASTVLGLLRTAQLVIRQEPWFQGHASAILAYMTMEFQQSAQAAITRALAARELLQTVPHATHPALSKPGRAFATADFSMP